MIGMPKLRSAGALTLPQAAGELAAEKVEALRAIEARLAALAAALARAADSGDEGRAAALAAAAAIADIRRDMAETATKDRVAMVSALSALRIDAPAVQVISPTAAPGPSAWVFHVERDPLGRIVRIDAKPEQ